MRTFGIDEKYITGAADYHDKYLAFASVFPMMIGNPVYIWCALELKRYFDIDEPLTADNAEEIYQRTKELIVKRHMTRRWCMEHSKGGNVAAGGPLQMAADAGQWCGRTVYHRRCRGL